MNQFELKLSLIEDEFNIPPDFYAQLRALNKLLLSHTIVVQPRREVMKIGDTVIALKTFKVGMGRVAINQGDRVEVVAVSQNGSKIWTSLPRGGLFGEVDPSFFQKVK